MWEKAISFQLMKRSARLTSMIATFADAATVGLRLMAGYRIMLGDHVVRKRKRRMEEPLTEELLQELLSAPDVKSFCEEHRIQKRSLSDYLQQQLDEKDSNGRRSCARRGSTTRSATRYSWGSAARRATRCCSWPSPWGFTLKEANRLLQAAGANELYCKDRRDAIIIFCLDHGYSAAEDRRGAVPLRRGHDLLKAAAGAPAPGRRLRAVFRASPRSHSATMYPSCRRTRRTSQRPCARRVLSRRRRVEGRLFRDDRSACTSWGRTAPSRDRTCASALSGDRASGRAYERSGAPSAPGRRFLPPAPRVRLLCAQATAASWSWSTWAARRWLTWCTAATLPSPWHAKCFPRLCDAVARAARRVRPSAHPP